MDYYDRKFKEFIERTKDIDLSFLYNPFEERLKGNKILDVGFGSGRDSLYFSKNYEVTSIDSNDAFVEYGKTILDNVLKMDVRDITYYNEYDGIWACASLLHLSKSDIVKVIEKLHNALTENGVLFMSFKYGDFEGIRDERHYTDFTEESFTELVKDNYDMMLFTSYDAIVGRSGQWLNVFITK